MPLPVQPGIPDRLEFSTTMPAPTQEELLGSASNLRAALFHPFRSGQRTAAPFRPVELVTREKQDVLDGHVFQLFAPVFAKIDYHRNPIELSVKPLSTEAESTQLYQEDQKSGPEIDFILGRG